MSIVLEVTVRKPRRVLGEVLKLHRVEAGRALPKQR